MSITLLALTDDDTPEGYELEEARAGVHYLLTGTNLGGEGPLAFLASEVGHVFDAERVVLVADLLESMPARVVRERLMSAELAAVDPFNGRVLEDDDKEWLLAVLQGLMTYMRRMATEQRSVVVA